MTPHEIRRSVDGTMFDKTHPQTAACLDVFIYSISAGRVRWRILYMSEYSQLGLRFILQVSVLSQSILGFILKVCKNTSATVHATPGWQNHTEGIQHIRFIHHATEGRSSFRKYTRLKVFFWLFDLYFVPWLCFDKEEIFIDAKQHLFLSVEFAPVLLTSVYFCVRLICVGLCLS